ncbi:MAG: hypothetical protein HYZ42_05045, partial [Bacteroidetes bacterium]|nr:hypothetical protein [Bacteroidota bacterium]
MHTFTLNQKCCDKLGLKRQTARKKLASYVTMVLTMMMFSSGVFAQLSSNYSTSKSSSGTYSPLTSGTVFLNASSSSMDDVSSGKIPLPSSFTFNGASYDTICINTNGYLSFIASGGTVPAGNVYTPISTTVGSGTIAAYARDLDKSAVSGTTPEISYGSVGSEFVIQWKDMGQWNNTTSRINFQIRLNLCNNLIRIMYGSSSVVTSNTGQVGLRGTSTADYLNWTITSGVWTTAATAGGANTATTTWSTTCVPANGGSFTYTPTSASALALTSINYNTTSVSGVAPGSNYNHIHRLDFNVTGLTGTLPLDSISLTSLNTNDGDVTAVKLFATNTAVFSTANQIGSTTTFSGGVATFSNINYNLQCGTNFVWVAYDVSGSATNGNILDGKYVANSIKVGGSTYPSTQKSPSGSRAVSSPMTFVSATGAQPNTSFVQRTASNQEIMRIQVTMSNTGAPISIDSLVFNTLGNTGTNNPSTNISNARVYYTGSSSTFSTSTQYGSVVASPNGAFTVLGYQALSTGDNYFFLTYDIQAGANLNDSADASLTNIYIGGSSQTVTSGSPSGFRMIRPIYCVPTSTAQCCGFAITNVTIGSINNTTTIETGAGAAYHNYTSMSTLVKKGSSYTISVTPGSYASGNQNIAAWIDFNGDGDFIDAGEKIGELTNMTPSTAYNYNFTVPCAASSGYTVLRLKHQYATTNIDPCANGNYLDVEDYTLIVQDSALSYITSLGTQPNTSDAQAGTGAMIMRMPVVAKGCSGSQVVTSFSLSTSGSTNASGDIDSAVVYYTGNSATYSAAGRFGVAASPSGSFTVYGSQALVTDSNNFWLVYFVKGSATIGDVIDAQFNQLTVNGNNQTPTITSPSGDRTINTAMTFVSADAFQPSTSAVVKGTGNNPVVGVAVVMSAGYSVNLTQIKFNLTGSTSVTNDVASVRIYYTGTSNLFSTSTQFGSLINSGLTSNPITANGSV